MFFHQPQSNPLEQAISSSIIKNLNIYLSNGYITNDQQDKLLRIGSANLSNLANYIMRNHGQAGNIHESALNDIIVKFLQESMKTLNNNPLNALSTGGMMGGNIVSFNSTPVAPTNIYQPIISSPSPSVQNIPQPITQEIKDIMYVNCTVDNPLVKINDVEGKLLSQHGMPGVIDIQSIKEYKNKTNNAVYRFISASYNVPEENDNEMVRNFITSVPNLTNHNKYMALIRYTKFLVMKNVDYDNILKDYEDVKKATQSRNFFEAIKELNKKSFNFSSDIKKLIVKDINDMLNLYVRTNTDLDVVIKFDELEEVRDLMECNHSLGVNAFMIDDFDGLILTIVTEVFNRYFGKESKIFTISNDIDHILSHSDILIRKSDFTDRDYYSLGDKLKKEFETELKNFVVFGFMSNCLLTNIFPNTVKETLKTHSAYVINAPSNSFESLIFDNILKGIKKYTIKAFSGSEGLNLNIGRTIEGDLILEK